MSIRKREQYVEYPKGKGPWPFVLMSHARGASEHLDLRMRVNDHLVGHTLFTPGAVGEPIKFRADIKNTPIRGTRKTPQPIWWMLDGTAGSPKVDIGEKFEVPPGEVGATRFEKGVFKILDRGVWWPGALKPWFFEYWLKGRKLFPEWTRVVGRVMRFQRIDPVTKKPTGQYEIGTIFQVPGNQTPYIFSKRAMEKGWVPPKGFIPLPPELRKGEQYEKWLEWVKEKWAEKHSLKHHALIPYVLHQVSWKGQEVVRKLPNLTWYLRLKTEGVRSFHLWENPLYVSPVSAFDEGRVDAKWFDYEGELKPQTEYNPNKRLTARMSILAKGNATIETLQEKPEILAVNFKSGELKGRWILEQEEEDSPNYQFYLAEELSKGRFVLEEHKIDDRVHYDVRIDIGAEAILEFNLPYNPVSVENQPAVKKVCMDKSWMKVKEDWEKKMVGDLETYVRTIDSGDVEVIETSQLFYSFNFKGKQLKGHYIAIKRDEGWRFEKNPMPWKLSKDPLEGKAYEKPKVVMKLGKLFVFLYDPKLFTRSEPDFREYLPDLKLEEGIEDVVVSLYQVPGTVRYARVSCVVFDPEKWSPEKAVEWVEEKRLKDFVKPQIKRESERREKG